MSARKKCCSNPAASSPAEGLTPGLGFQVATPTAIRDKRPELEDFVRRLAAARAWSAGNVSSYAETWGKLMNIPHIGAAQLADAGEDQDHADR